MSKIDETIEFIRYLKIFFTVILASIFALSSWLAKNFNFNSNLLWLSIILIFLFAFCLGILLKVIMKKIKGLRRL